MISSLRGTVLSRQGNLVVVEVQGVGYALSVPDRLALALAVGEDTLLHTAMVVREDNVALYGFGSAEELGLFDLLRSVNGVGPKSALAILSQVSPADIAQAVTSENDAVFRQVSGIGPKTAKLIVLSLQGAFDQVSLGTSPIARDAGDEVTRQSVVQALVGLGWSDRAAKAGVAEAIEAHAGEAVDTASLLRHALAILGPQTNREVR